MEASRRFRAGGRRPARQPEIELYFLSYEHNDAVAEKATPLSGDRAIKLYVGRVALAKATRWAVGRLALCRCKLPASCQLFGSARLGYRRLGGYHLKRSASSSEVVAFQSGSMLSSFSPAPDHRQRLNCFVVGCALPPTTRHHLLSFWLSFWLSSWLSSWRRAKPKQRLFVGSLGISYFRSITGRSVIV